MSHLPIHDRALSASETIRKSTQARKALSEANYYRGRAEDHRRMTECTTPAIHAIHLELAAAYDAAATITERGEVLDFAGFHRGEQPLEIIPTPQQSGALTIVE